MSVISSVREARAVLLAVDPGVAAPCVGSWGPVTVTGSRACTRYGETVAGELGLGLAEAGVTVCTGGGFGIDAAATRGALAGAGPVVLVGAAGVDVAYPAAHAELVARVLDEGGVLVATSPGLPPSRARFTARNQVMAALSRAVVVVEAAAHSGVRDAAHTATMLGVPVGAVPGPITSVTSAGCHQLLADGAHLITCLRDVLALTGEAPDRG